MIKRSLFFTAALGFNMLAYCQEDLSRVKIETDSGSITIELYNETPLHRDNFLKLAREGYYDGTSFHRVIENFMIQGGDPNSKEGGQGIPGNGGPGYTIPAEFNPALFHQKGALCAARKGDNVNPEQASSGSQFYLVQGRTFSAEQLKGFEQQINAQLKNNITRAFFTAAENKEYLDRLVVAKKEANNEEIMAIMEEIEPMIDAKLDTKRFVYTAEQKTTYETIGGTPHLDLQYTVFGQVVDGLDVIDKIASVPKNGEQPITPLRMKVLVLE